MAQWVKMYLPSHLVSWDQSLGPTQLSTDIFYEHHGMHAHKETLIKKKKTTTSFILLKEFWKSLFRKANKIYLSDLAFIW